MNTEKTNIAERRMLTISIRSIGDILQIEVDVSEFEKQEKIDLVRQIYHTIHNQF